MHPCTHIRKLLAVLLLACCSFAVTAQPAPQQEDETIAAPETVEERATTVEEHPYQKRYYDSRRLDELRNQPEFQYDKTYEKNDEGLREISDKEYFSDSSRRYRSEREQNTSRRESSSGSKERSSNRQSSSSASSTPPPGSGSGLLILILFLALVIVLMIVLKLKPGSLFRRSPGKEVAPEETATENIHQIHFESELEKAIRLKNFRLALRIMYLETLKKLTDKNIINWQPEKTNWDYVREINNPQLKKPFTEITNAYDYAWYGEFSIDEPLFRIMQEKMNGFRKIMGN